MVNRKPLAWTAHRGLGTMEAMVNASRLTLARKGAPHPRQPPPRACFG